MKYRQENTLFDFEIKKAAPLAERMRPQVLKDFVGQKHIVAEGSLLWRAIKADRVGSCIFWGPPGTGKTTLANIIANSTDSHFEKLNAVASGVADAKKIIDEAEKGWRRAKRHICCLTSVTAGPKRSRTACWARWNRA